MKSLKFLAAFLILLSGSALKSQTDLLKDPEVIWIGETSIIFNPDLNRSELREKLKIGGFTQVLKKVVPNDKIRSFDENNEHLSLANILLQSKQKVYHDSLLQKQMNSADLKKALNYMDTIITFDPETFKEKVTIQPAVADAYSISGFKMRVQVYYHKKDMMYRTVPLAIAPVLFTGKILYWMPMSASAVTELSNNNVNWAVRLAYTCPLKGNNIKEIKKSDKYSFEYFFEKINEKKITAYVPFDILGAGQNQLINKDEVSMIGATVDTIITVDPTTKNEIKTVVLNYLFPEDISQVRFVQDWYWDDQKQQLFYRHLGFAPLMNRYDQNGNFLNSGPMFYIREKGVE
jgi:hypothetical protein